MRVLEAIVGFVLEGVPLAFGAVAATDILHDDYVSASCTRKAHAYFIIFVVRRAL